MIAYAQAVDAMKRERRLAKYRRYNASAKGRERHDQYRATVKGILTVARYAVRRHRATAEAAFAAYCS